MKKMFAGFALAGVIGVSGILVSAEWKDYKAISLIEKESSKAAATKTTSASIKEVENPLNLESKKDVQERLLNSYHFFDKAKGSFTYFSKGTGMNVQIDYHLKWNDKKLQYHAKISDQLSKSGHELGFANGKFTSVDHGAKQFETFKWDVPNKGEFKSIEDVYVTNADGTKEYQYPLNNLNLGMAEKSLHAKEIAVGFLEDHELWNVSGTETLLEREAVVIKGEFASYYLEKLGARTFTLWMDKNTGILLKYELYDDNGNVTDRLETIDIKINDALKVKDLSESLPSDYKKYVPVRGS